MLTNTPSPTTQDSPAITATTIAIEEAERHCRAALRDLAQLVDTGEISPQEAADLEREALARFTAHARDLELHGAQLIGAERWARYEERAASRRAAQLADRLRSPRLRGIGARTRARRERQMCVVTSARISTELTEWLRDEDEETLETRRELAAAGLL